MSKTTIPTGGLADSAVTTAKITDGTIATADIADSAVTAAKATGLGISMADQWRVNTDATFTSGNNNDDITANWERNDQDFAGIGTALSESSGIFTFPTTGIYLVQAEFCFTNREGGTNRNLNSCGLRIQFDSGDNSFTTRAEQRTSADDTGNESEFNAACQAIIDVTDVSNQFFKINVEHVNNMKIIGCRKSAKKWNNSNKIRRYIMARPSHIEDALVEMHGGQWFGWSDSKNKIYANLIVHPKIYDANQGKLVDSTITKPSESAVNAKLKELQDAWDAEQTKQTTDEASGKTKLKNLGLTDDEIKALTGR